MGTGQINVYANDGLVDSEVISFNVQIDNVNDSPILANILSPSSVDEDGDNIVIPITPEDFDLS